MTHTCKFRQSHTLATCTKPTFRPPRAPSPSTDLLVMSCRVQVQLPIRANALGQQCLCIGQPLAQVIHVTVELPPLLYGAVKTPAAEQRNTHTSMPTYAANKGREQD